MSLVSAPVPDSTVIEVLRLRSKIGVVLATLLMLAFGALAFYGIASGQAHGVGETVIATFFGLLFAGIGVWAAISSPAIMGRHRLIFDRAGVRYDLTLGAVKPFTVRWPELAAIAVSTAEHDSRTNTSTLVRLDLTPADPTSFAALHPEMSGLARGTGYRLPLGPNRFLIDKLAHALNTYAGDRDRGIVDDGRASGLTYT